MFSALLFIAAFVGAPPTAGRDLVAVQAGTIHVVEGGRVIEGGGTVLIQSGKIVGVGDHDFAIPAGARVVDYGPDAVIIPGLVAVESHLGGSSPSERTAEPGLAAIDGFDILGNYASFLASGVTTVYLAPAQNRLIGGHGAVVKLGGQPGAGRVITATASVHGSISADARRTPGYWQPPVPATVDVGMGVEKPQLPRTTMGAIIALRELLSLASDPKASEEYGPYVGAELAALIKTGTTWRMTAETPGEIRALVEFFKENGLPLVIDGADQGGELADWLSSQGVPVVVHSAAAPNLSPRDRGKGEDDAWPDAQLASKLSRAGVTVAIAPGSGSVIELRFYASLARQGGMSSADALAGITANAARILGVSDRVGSLASGKDADLVVLNGAPLSATTSLIATWVDGEVAYKSAETGSVVVEVDQLHLGSGQVLSPGQLLMEDGIIVEVGRRVAHPIGCTVVRGVAAMPGMIDTLGHLGLEGSSKAPKTSFKLSKIVEPGDFADRRVAQVGVTTVLMTPRGTSTSGAPALAYKPAGSKLDRMIIADPAAIHLQWSNANRLEAGKSVLSLLEKATEYKNSWDTYEVEIAKWAPPAEGEKAEEAKEEGEEKKAEEEGEKKDTDTSASEDDEKKPKKKKGEEEPPQPVTGVWLAMIEGEGSEARRLRIQLLQTGDTLEGRLRCGAVSESLVIIHGERKEHGVELSGLGSHGDVTLSGKTEEGKLRGKVSGKGKELEFEAEQTSKDYVVAGRQERREEKREEKKDPKGKPKSPGINEDLEPLRAAIEGRATIVCTVERFDEILDCVAAFEKAGIKPVLSDADEAWKVAEQLVGRVKGILLDHRVIYSDSRMGVKRRNRYAELTNAGIDVAFHSNAEEGAAELPLMAAYAVSQGMSPTGAIRALTSAAAEMMSIGTRVGSLRSGLDADVLLLDGDPLDVGTSVQRVWVGGREIRLH
jgi:imidazolonepropionase-like amidohydrolase